MKVVILTEGGKEVGFGHVTRCVALWQALQEEGLAPEFIIDGDGSVLEVVGDIPCQLIDWCDKKEYLQELITDATVVVVDSYLADKGVYEQVAERVKVPLYIDDTRRLPYPRGIVVNSLTCAEDFHYSKKENNVYLLGTKYAPLRKSFWVVPQKKINGDLKNVLILFGGRSFADLARDIKASITQRFKVLSPNLGVANTWTSPEQIVNLMFEADVCISGGGQTVYELAQCGVPVIGICFAQNQLLNLKKCAQAGFLEFIGWYSDKNINERILRALSGLAYKRRVEMSKTGRGVVDGQGAKRIVEDILRYAEV